MTKTVPELQFLFMLFLEIQGVEGRNSGPYSDQNLIQHLTSSNTEITGYVIYGFLMQRNQSLSFANWFRIREVFLDAATANLTSVGNS